MAVLGAPRLVLGHSWGRFNGVARAVQEQSFVWHASEQRSRQDFTKWIQNNPDSPGNIDDVLKMKESSDQADC